MSSTIDMDYRGVFGININLLGDEEYNPPMKETKLAQQWS